MAHAAVPQVTVYWDPDQELYHTCYIYSGLLELARSGAVELRVRVPASNAWQKAERGELVVFSRVVHESSSHVDVCWDLRDRSDRFSTRAFDRTHVYFKRSYFRTDVEALGATATRIVPFGINFASRARGLLTRTLVAMVRAGHQELPRLTLRQVGHWGAGFRSLLAVRRTRDFLCLPATRKEQRVLFQTRVWSPDHVRDDDVEAINTERVAIIRALREAFGPRAQAGVPDSSFARRLCPDLITAGESSPRAYTRLNCRLLVGVYTRGLHHSTAWKLGEYLAASMCVVGSPLRNALPTPLRDGVEMAYATTPEEVVARTADILGDPLRQRTMREAAFDYYRRQIDPATHVRWSLLEGLRLAGGQALPA